MKLTQLCLGAIFTYVTMKDFTALSDFLLK